VLGSKRENWLAWIRMYIISKFTGKLLSHMGYGEGVGVVLSEWLLFNAKSVIVQLYHGENKLIFNEMMMRSALY
jgi:hypothetical protein